VRVTVLPVIPKNTELLPVLPPRSAQVDRLIEVREVQFSKELAPIFVNIEKLDVVREVQFLNTSAAHDG